ncbi:MAG: hypothetical protein Q7R39_08970 [Dehalococcoidia bacterium]|nr:hypothetical protein [Dehalococcoidia bacterium]
MDDSDDLRKIVGDVLWLTKSGSVDLTKFPIDATLRQALAVNWGEYRDGLSTLRSMHSRGRQEAGVFLLGLLVSSDHDWQKKTEIAEALWGYRTRACADLLLGEIKRVKNSNTTRRYLDSVIKTLAYMPQDLVRPGLLALIADTTLSRRTREKLDDALWEASRGGAY